LLFFLHIPAASNDILTHILTADETVLDFALVPIVQVEQFYLVLVDYFLKFEQVFCHGLEFVVVVRLRKSQDYGVDLD
jgi:hypothetical protein